MQLQNLQETLSAERGRIFEERPEWGDVRSFYSGYIDEALGKLSASVVEDKSPRATLHMALVELAWARESMGLLRAAMSRIYARNETSQDEVIYLAKEYGIYTGHMRMFKRTLKSQGVAAPETLFEDPYARVMQQIEAMLQQGARTVQERDHALWWQQATHVIDDFKSVEDGFYVELITAADREIHLKKQALLRYTSLGLGLGLLAALLTLFTILRILRALGILINTLDEVVRSENYAVRISGESPRDEFGKISLSLNNLLDFTDRLIRDKDKLASTDLLTGLLNRRSFLESAGRELARAKRYASSFALIFLDIDHFKQINDTYGHASGDEALIRLAQVLKSVVRETDLVARWGGEEFVVLVPKADLEQGGLLAEKLRAEVAAAAFPAVGHVTCSLGVAAWAADESFDALCQRADGGLYRAKQSGRNRVCKVEG